MKAWVVGLFLFLAVLGIGIFASRGVGTSWDEPDNIHAGGVYAKFFTHGLDPAILTDRNASVSVWYDKIFTQEPTLSRYPPVPIFVGVLVVKAGEIWNSRPATAQEIIYAFHIASTIFLGLFVVTMYALLRAVRIPAALAFTTSILAGLHPTIFGYGLSDIKDCALLSLFTLSLLFLIKSTMRKRKRYFVLGAIFWGLALATKINAIYVPVIWLSWRFVYEVIREMGEIKEIMGIGVKLRQIGMTLMKTLGFGGVLVVIGIVVMVLVWPYLWFDPVGRIMEVLKYFTTVGAGYKVFWNQELYMVGAGKALAWYPIAHTIIGTPLTYLALAVFGLLGLVFWSIFKKTKPDLLTSETKLADHLKIGSGGLFKFLPAKVSKLLIAKQTHKLATRKDTVLFLWLTLIWICVPLIRTFSPTASFYDGMRHFLEVLPPIFILMAFGIDALKHLLVKFVGHKGVKLLYLTVLVVLTHIVFVNLHLFPYGTGYVNALASNPNTTLERDFSGLAIKEGVELAHKLKGGSMAVFVPIAGHLSWYWLTGGDLYVYAYEQADVLILINKSSHVSKAQFDPLVTSMFDLKTVVRRGRDEFAWVYLRK